MSAGHKSERPGATGRDAKNQGNKQAKFTAHEHFVFGVLRQLEDGQRFLQHAAKRLADPKCGVPEMQQIGQQLALLRAEQVILTPFLKAIGVAI